MLETGCQIVFVSGKAGTGKSTLIQYLRHTYKNNIVVVAPTGVAALNVNGVTLNSYFQLPPRIISETDIKEVKDRRLYTRLDLLIVDEISMVRADMIDAMDTFLRLNGRSKDLPFGGTQLLFVGDLFQLPPVVTKQDESVLDERGYSSPFFFSAKSLELCQMASVELTEIFRQRDPEFAAMLSDIRVAENLETVIPKINDNCTPTEDDNSIITLSCTNAVADRVKGALLSSAAAIVLLHNHPSGDPLASREDREITRRLKEAGDLLGIRVLDHIICGDTYMSFVEMGLL